MLARPETTKAETTFAAISGEEAWFDHRGALFLPALSTLVVSDLHLEKGSSYARRGRMLPPYDSLATMKRLSVLIDVYRPSTVVSLGDSFHDAEGASRLPDFLRSELETLAKGRDWFWITGNHDPRPQAGIPGEWLHEINLNTLILRHEPALGAGPGEIAGHLHPGARVVVRGRSVRRACFATDGNRLIIPAFGAFAGTLNVLDRAYTGLFDWSTFRALMLGSNRLYDVPRDALRHG